MILESVIACPHCAAAKSETMPTDCLSVFLYVHRLRRNAAAEGGRLLRVLFLCTDPGRAFE